MKRIVLEAPERFAVQEVEAPRPGPGEALVRIGKVGVCGSDVHLYRDGHIGDIVAEGPVVIGHECMGVVEAVGEGVGGDLVGRRVAVEPARHCGRCRWCATGRRNMCPEMDFMGLPPTPGAFQEYLVHPADLLEPLPEAVSDEAAVVMEPLAIALHAVNLSRVQPGMSVVILGTGVMGTCVLMLLGLQRGARVVCVDLLPERLERAGEMGAATVRAEPSQRREVEEAVLDIVGGYGADIVFECAGADETQWNMCEIAAPGGHAMVIGTNAADTVTYCCGTARRKAITIRTVRRSLNTLPACIELAARGLIRPELLVTHRFPAGRIAEAFQTVAGYRDGVLKALVDMRAW